MDKVMPGNKATAVTFCNLRTSFFQDDQLMPQVLAEMRRFNDQEALGIESRKTKMARAEVQDQTDLDKSTLWEEGRIRTKMLWKGEFSKLPATEFMARRRLKWLEWKLARQPGLREKYKATIDADLSKGYIRKLTKEEAEQLRKNHHWFLPHFVVLHPDKPDRPRRVLDCAAKVELIALNSLLRAGPNNLADLWGIMLRFRSGMIIIGADITEMFSQVKVYDEDQPMLAFLWSDKPGEEPDVYVNTRHVFGAKCSPAVANNAVRFAVHRVFPAMLQMTMKEFYMDDLLHPSDDPETAIANAKAFASALQDSGFRLCKWVSNCLAALQQLPQEDLAPSFKDFIAKDEGEFPTMKALGLRWNTEKDTLGFCTRLKFEEPTNVAQCLSQLASVYDLLRIIGPYLMKGKLLFRDILASKSWRDPLTPEEMKKWMAWLTGLEKVAQLTIPRWFGFKKSEPVALHIFSDASNEGYGASAVLTGSGERRAFVASKCYVISKAKPLTVPKNELQALIVGCRMAQSAIEHLEGYTNIVRLVFWVDSACVWHWARSERQRFKDFVANRLGELAETIKDLKEQRPEVRWLPTGDNPADLASRGCDADEFVERFPFWINGPEWLTEAEDQWPKPPQGPIKEEELRLQEALSTKAHAATKAPDPLQRFKSLRDYVVEELKVPEPSAEDITNAERTLVLEIQAREYAKEIKEVIEAADQGQSSVILRKGPLHHKAAFLDRQGILRIVARWANAKFLSWSERFPIPLATKHGGTRLLIRDYHGRVHHQGGRTTFAAMSKKYLIAFKCVKREVFSCEFCREQQPLKVQVPQASLPGSRLEAWTHVFKNTGMDFFGPFVIQGRKKKVWALMFTCLTTRAVHLEPCMGIDVQSWLLALERFVSRRGNPEMISCDLGSVFVSGSKEVARLEVEQLTPEFCEAVAKEVLAKMRIEFRFIPHGTSHYGGPWERMIREARQSIVKSASTVARLNYDAFATFLTRAECVINRRPLAIGDDLEIVTPASILAPTSEMGVGFSSRLSVTRITGQIRQAVDHFWRFWTNHYIKRLSASRYPPHHARFVQLKIGDKVLFRRREQFHSLDTRAALEAGKVIQVFPSNDGVIRRVAIQTKDNQELEVPVKRVFLAEADLVARSDAQVGLKVQQ